jgi:uncharacterized radical SAM protein YgiQ
MNSYDNFLPTTQDEMARRGWEVCDFVIITGDAYVDHPSFGAALIGRLLESQGYAVGIIAQPAWDSPDDFRRLGRPRLAFMITSGNIDSMVAHYTSSHRPRTQDSYSPGGTCGLRPDRAVITYTARARQAYKQVPVIIGGLEASLRRLSHYDYWSDTVRRSILLDAKADLLIYGMGEHPVTAVCQRLREGVPVGAIRDIPGTVIRLKRSDFLDPQRVQHCPEVFLPGYEEVSARDKHSNIGSDTGKQSYARSINLRILHENALHQQRLIEEYPDCFIIQNPVALPLSTAELDSVYELHYARRSHPMYDSYGGVPGLGEVRYSITSSRGCFGGCSFCALTFHQGRIVQARSSLSMIREAEELTHDTEFKGYIHDVGGPTANFSGPSCKRQAIHGACTDRQCLFPEPCPALQDTHEPYLKTLVEMRELPGVKKVFIRSGIRYDYLLAAAPEQTRDRFIQELCTHHVSGQLKVAPEHVSSRVLDAMGKPGIEVFEEFSTRFAQANDQAGKKQYIIPYFISGHPGSTLDDAIELARYLQKSRFIPDQVQDFYPTPGTVSTCMYYTGLDPRPGRDFAPVYIPKGREKHLQRALIHFHKPENHALVIEALTIAGRTDLIGEGPSALVRRRGPSSEKKKRRNRR